MSQIQTQSTTLLNPLFSDDAVLQRDHIIPIWGQAAPGAAVTVKLGAQTRTARADASGGWMARIGPFAASNGAHTLAVSSGDQTATRQNVVFGDVWLCSGQSNMEMGLGEIKHGPQEIAAANFPLIRLFTVPKLVAFQPQKVVNSRWLVCNPQNAAKGTWNGFSATAYFFGRKLHQELGVPIGLLHSSWGGTEAESWVSQSALGTLPDFKAELSRSKPLCATKACLMMSGWRRGSPKPPRITSPIEPRRNRPPGRGAPSGCRENGRERVWPHYTI